MAKKMISDHIMVVSQANGSKKAAPCWQIRAWIQKGSFSLEVPKSNPVGYDFVDHRGGVAEYKEWETEQKRLAMIRRSAVGPQHRDGGIADAQFHLRGPASVPSAFDEVPETGVPVMESGSKELPAKPEDVI